MASTTREHSTRERVRDEISEHGPVTAATLAETLGLTPTAVRRHLDALAEAGFIEERDAPGASRGRGRPARAYVLSAAGHSEMTGAYDDIATDALRFLHEHAGEQAVESFAAQRLTAAEERYRAAVEDAGDDLAARAEALARALSQDGYAATTRSVTTPSGEAAVGLQICQGHCPMQHVASEFPQFCDAERDVFARLLGANVQRLATLAHGEHVCTTFVPLTTLTTQTHRPSTANERSTR